MTFGQLKSAVAALGFEGDVEGDAIFLNALSRALYMISTDRPTVRIKKLSRTPFPGRLIADCFIHNPDSSERFPLRGRALSFAVSGKGKYTVSTNGSSRTESFDTDLSHIRIHLGKGSSISFEGEFGYTVLGLCDIYSTRSDKEEDIPLWDERALIRLGDLCRDFMSPAKPPMDIWGGVIEGASICGGMLYLPEDFLGEVILTYNRSPVMPGGLDDGEIIDIAEELTELLPLAVASFVWLDDDPEKAQYYLSLYKDGINTLRRFHPREVGAAYVTNGWA